jgi:hypothetical protein
VAERVFYNTSVKRIMACDYTVGIDTTSIPALCSMDVVAILVKYRVNGDGRTVMVCYAYFLYDG